MCSNTCACVTLCVCVSVRHCKSLSGRCTRDDPIEIHQKKNSNSAYKQIKTIESQRVRLLDACPVCIHEVALEHRHTGDVLVHLVGLFGSWVQCVPCRVQEFFFTQEKFLVQFFVPVKPFFVLHSHSLTFIVQISS